MRWQLAAIGAAGLIAGGPAMAQAGEPAPAPVYWRTDPATGATIRLFRPAPDRIFVEVTAAGLTIQKSLGPGRVDTRLVTPDEDVVIGLDRRGVFVTDSRLGLTADGRTPTGLERARSRLRASAAVNAAVALLDGLEPVAGSPVTGTLLVTQAMLESALGTPGAGRDLERWVQRPIAGARTVRVAWQDGQELLASPDGPTDCWEEYVAEAIAAWIEYEQCVDSEEWWDAPGLLSCLVIYDMRAIGAFSWWVSCVGFRG